MAAFLAIFLFDAGKAAAACLIAIKFIPDYAIALTLASFFVVLGHNYSLFLKFRGGRGAASLLGILLFFDWRAFLAWFGTVLITAVVFEAIESKKISEKIAARALDRQIIGRLAGEILALAPVYFINQTLFWPTLFATPLILIKHKDRLRRQLKEIARKG